MKTAITSKSHKTSFGHVLFCLRLTNKRFTDPVLKTSHFVISRQEGSGLRVQSDCLSKFISNLPRKLVTMLPTLAILRFMRVGLVSHKTIERFEQAVRTCGPRRCVGGCRGCNCWDGFGSDANHYNCDAFRDIRRCGCHNGGVRQRGDADSHGECGWNPSDPGAGELLRCFCGGM
jgi:hypothetical protein